MRCREEPFAEAVDVASDFILFDRNGTEAGRRAPSESGGSAQNFSGNPFREERECQSPSQ